MRQLFLIGHGSININETFEIPKNVYVIEYCQDGGSISNSAIQLISETALEKLGENPSIQNLKDYSLTLNLKLKTEGEKNINFPVTIKSKGDSISTHYLYPLKNGLPEGSQQHIFQHNKAMKTLSNIGIVKSERELNRAIPRSKYKKRIRLENIIKHEKFSNPSEIIILHWLMCRSIQGSQPSIVRYPKYSIQNKHLNNPIEEKKIDETIKFLSKKRTHSEAFPENYK